MCARGNILLARQLEECRELRDKGSCDCGSATLPVTLSHIKGLLKLDDTYVGSSVAQEIVVKEKVQKLKWRLEGARWVKCEKHVWLTADAARTEHH